MQDSKELCSACELGDLEELIRFFTPLSQQTRSAYLNSIIDKRRSTTALMLAASKNRTKCIRLLLSFGADVNYVNNAAGFSALHYAAAVSAKACLLLLAAGARVNQQSVSFLTPLHVAAKNGLSWPSHNQSGS